MWLVVLRVAGSYEDWGVDELIVPDEHNLLPTADWMSVRSEAVNRH